MLNKRNITVFLSVLALALPGLLLGAQNHHRTVKYAPYALTVQQQHNVAESQEPQNDGQSEERRKPGETIKKNAAPIIQVPEQHRSVKYFDACGNPGEKKCHMLFDVYSFMECPFVLYDSRKKRVVEGQFKKGKNTIKFPYDSTFIRTENHAYQFSVINNGSAEELDINFKIQYDWAKEFLDFNPVTGEVGLKLKPEFQKKLVITKKIELDKKVLVKSGLVKILTGAALLLATPQVNKFNEKIETRSMMTSVDSSKKVFRNFGIGFTVSGVFGIVKAFKRKTYRRDILVKDLEAIAYNKNLREKQEELKGRIMATVTVKVAPADTQKEGE